MKPHLPINLLFALVGAVAAHAVEVPADYELIDLWVPSYLDDYISNEAEDKYAFTIWTDVNFTPSTSDTWTTSKPLVTGGNLIFSTAEGFDPMALSFSEGKSTVFDNLSTLTFDTLSNLTFSNQNASMSGGAIDLGSSGKLYIRNVNDGVDNPEVADVVFSLNSSETGCGGSIYANGANTLVDISDNGDIAFVGNSTSVYSSSAYGGAIYSTGTVSICNNEDVVFGGNSVSSSNSYPYGGAIYSTGTVSICNNVNVSFLENFSSVYNTYGGAIYSTGTLSISNNADVLFNGNFTTSNYNAYGGAIYSSGSVSVNNNTDVAFVGNYATSSANYSYVTYGGAIYSTGTVSIRNNAMVDFRGNFVTNRSSYACGGAIYSIGSVAIEGNDNVVFEKNYERYGRSSYSYRLRGLYMAPNSSQDSLILSAKTGKSITFYDSVYMKNYSGSIVSFNADYEDKAGKTQKSKGDIIFSGLYAEQHLNEIIEADNLNRVATSSEITSSQTSEIFNQITLYGGSLQVVDGARLNGRGLTLAADSGAKLLLRDGSMSHSGYNFTFNSGTALELQGLNTISATKLTLGSGTSLSVTLGEANLNTAALALGNTNLATSKLTLNLNRTDGLTSGMYKIISQNSAYYFTTSAAWTEENVTLNAGGYADRAEFCDLVWQNGTLYYSVGKNIWGNASGDRLWNTTSDNWTMNDRSYTYLDGMDVYFSDQAAGQVKLVGDIAPASIEVNNSEGADYIFVASAAGGKLVGSTSITKNGAGALTISMANNHTGATVLNKGTLNLHHSSALGASSLTTLADTTVNVDNRSHVVLSGQNSIAGNVSVAAGSTLELRSAGYSAANSAVAGTLVFNGSSASTTNAGCLTGTGTVRVTDASVSFASQSNYSGSMSVTGTGASLTVSNGAYSAAGTLSACGSGAVLNFGTNNVTLKAGGKIQLSSALTEESAAKLIAHNVNIGKDSTLCVAGTPSDSVLPEASVWGLGDADSVANSVSVGLADVSKLTFNSGACYEALFGNLDMNGGELTLAVPSVKSEKIELLLRYDIDYRSDMRVVLFSDVDTANFIYNGQVVIASGSEEVYCLTASDYFIGGAIGEDTLLVYDNGTVYLTGVLIPEPTTATLSLLALSALAARRRRK